MCPLQVKLHVLIIAGAVIEAFIKLHEKGLIYQGITFFCYILLFLCSTLILYTRVFSKQHNESYYQRYLTDKELATE